MSMPGSRGVGGLTVGRDPLKIHNNIGFLLNTGPDPSGKSQSYQASIQWQAIISPLAKCPLKGLFTIGPMMACF